MLDFFEQQAKARRRTAWLLFVYFAGVAIFVSVVAPVFMAMVLLVGQCVSRQPGASDPWSRVGTAFVHAPLDTLKFPEGRLAWAIAGGGTLLLVFGASAGRTISLRNSGGRAVPESLGGRLVVPGSGDFYDQRLLNVVEEMAIASSVPVPPVYVLDGEAGINAFAAGYSTSDAVVTVTSGCERQLTREQLQGVIAHEFSHILNGDMRLSIRLIGLLYGMIVVQLGGRLLLEIGARSGRDSRRDGVSLTLLLMAFGLLFMIIGAVGGFMARVIKAMIGRQREYLADASAVQFTRDPSGLAGALRVVGGSGERGVLRASQADEYSHLFFVDGVSGWFAGLIASHPPLEDRIRRLDPAWDGTWLAARRDGVEFGIGAAHGQAGGAGSIAGLAPLAALERSSGVAPSGTLSVARATTFVGGLTPEEVFARVNAAKKMLDKIDPVLLTTARDPHDARGLVLAMLLDRVPDSRPVQLQMIAEKLDAAVSGRAAGLGEVLGGIGPGVRLTLLQVALSALSALSAQQYQEFRQAIDAANDANRHMSLFQVCVQRMMTVHLDRKFGLAAPPAVQYYALTRLGDECSVLLSAIALVGSQDAERARADVCVEAQRLGVQSVKLLTAAEITPARLNAALSVLATTTARLRTRIVRACAEIVGEDGMVTASEAELLRVVADCMDVPLALAGDA